MVILSRRAFELLLGLLVHVVEAVVPPSGMIRVDDDFENVATGQVKVVHVVVHLVQEVEPIGFRAPRSLDLDRKVFRVHVLAFAHDRVHEVRAIDHVTVRHDLPVGRIAVDLGKLVRRKLIDLVSDAFRLMRVHAAGRQAGEQWQ